MAGGGNYGSPQDATKYPKHYMGAHQALMLGTGTGEDEFDGYTLPLGMLEALSNALDGTNPFTDVSAYDSSPNMATVETRQTLFESLVDALNSVSDWGTFATVAQYFADDVFTPEGSEEASVAAFKAASLPDFAAAINASMANLYTSNAAETAALPNALFGIRGRQAAAVAIHRATLKRDIATARASFIIQSISQMDGMLGMKLDATKATAGVRTEVETLKVNTAREALTDEVEFRYKEQTYTLNLFPTVGNTLASFSGGVQMPLGPSKLSQAISTGAALAAQGVALGSKAGPAGAIFGGVIGAGAGALSALAGGK